MRSVRIAVLCSLVLSACNCGGSDPTGPFGKARIRPTIITPEIAEVKVTPVEPAQVEVVPFPLLPPILRGPRQTDTFTQERAVVDVLWIVDNSGSLTNERDRLAAQFDRFLDVLVAADVDYHVGVTSTDLNSINGDFGRLRGDPRYIDPDTPQPEAVFAEMVEFPDNVEVRLEEGLTAIVTALTPPLVDGYNSGFLREEAALAVIVVSDEDDSSIGTNDQFLRFLRTLKGPGREVNTSLSAVVGPEPDGCVAPGEEFIFGARAKEGTRYLELARETNGLIESICTADFAPFIEELAIALAGLRRFFPLSAPPGANIHVFVDGREIPMSATMGWVLREDRRGIEFPGAYVPPPGAEIRIEYDVAL
jgi:hypothetical protein